MRPRAARLPPLCPKRPGRRLCVQRDAIQEEESPSSFIKSDSNPPKLFRVSLTFELFPPCVSFSSWLFCINASGSSCALADYRRSIDHRVSRNLLVMQGRTLALHVAIRTQGFWVRRALSRSLMRSNLQITARHNKRRNCPVIATATSHPIFTWNRASSIVQNMY